MQGEAALTNPSRVSTVAEHPPGPFLALRSGLRVRLHASTPQGVTSTRTGLNLSRNERSAPTREECILRWLSKGGM